MSITVNDRTLLLPPRSSALPPSTSLHWAETPPIFKPPRAKASPPEINNAIVQVLHAIKEGLPISISTLPKEVTTTTAASMLGITRPTLMKHVRNGRIPAHMVGSHHRLLSSDVLTFREELKEEKRQAVFSLMDLENELGEQEQRD